MQVCIYAGNLNFLAPPNHVILVRLASLAFTAIYNNLVQLYDISILLEISKIASLPPESCTSAAKCKSVALVLLIATQPKRSLISYDFRFIDAWVLYCPLSTEHMMPTFSHANAVYEVFPLVERRLFPSLFGERVHNTMSCLYRMKDEWRQLVEIPNIDTV